MHTCLHCGNDTPLYCEKCLQELIAKNAELQLENKFLRDENNIYRNETVSKSVIRDKIEELEKELKEYDLGEYCLYEDSIQEKIKIYEELLK